MLKKQNQKGFTIIEVLIVLAIAALIMLVVFLAVPALQRSQRNNARVSDASLFAAAINDCLTNQNGNPTNCKSIGNANVSWTPANANQLTGVSTYNAAVTAGTTTTMVWTFNATCNGAVSQLGGSSRQFAVTYQIESSGGTQDRCLAS